MLNLQEIKRRWALALAVPNASPAVRTVTSLAWLDVKALIEEVEALRAKQA